MKKIYLLLTIILATGHCSIGQHMSVFGTNSTSWNIIFGNLGGGYNDSIYVVGDTIINGENWQKLKLTFGDIGLLKEDTVMGQLFYRNFYWDTTITMIADFGLDVGDSFLFNHMGYKSWIVVDSVFLNGDAKIIRFNYTLSSNEKLMFIEGIGTNIGVTYPESYMMSPYLMCMYKDDTLYYQNNHPTYKGDCSVEWTYAGPYNEPEPVRVYPNPSRGNLHVELPHSGSWVYALTDLSGRIIRQGVIEENQAVIEMPGNQTGVYLLQVIERQTGQTYWSKVTRLRN